MASIVYFKKVEEAMNSAWYVFGTEPEEMHRRLQAREEGSPSEPDDGVYDYIFLKASRKISALRAERGEWPVKGMSVS